MNDTIKPIQTLQELAKNLKSDRYYFVLPCSAGDFYHHLLLKSALERKLNGKITFVIKPSHETLCDIFDCKDYVICSDKEIVENFWYPQWLYTENAVSVPTKGKFYPSHSGHLCMPVAFSSMLNWHLEWFDLPRNTKGDLPTNLPKLSESLREKLAKIAPLDKIMLFCPEANSRQNLPLIIFKDECDKLLKLGYKIIVNIPNHKEYTHYFSDCVYDLDLSLKDAIALALHCAGVVSTRSGFCDIIAPHCKKLKIYYTSFDYWWRGRLKDINPTNALKEVLIYDMPIYKQFLRMTREGRESLPLKLYKRYATKGFLRKLRTPFTLYFKIYKRHKVGEYSHDLGDLSDSFECKSMQEFVKSELAKTYEYQLGLALQRACERFWRGGFLAFPFAYAKIRSQKGKTLTRMDGFII